MHTSKVEPPSLESPSRSDLDAVLFAVFGTDKAFAHLLNDHWDGLAPKAHGLLWDELITRAPMALSAQEVVRVWTKDEIALLYRAAIHKLLQAAEARCASRDIRRP